ncbi:hypothetical protein AURDEDRAFT_178044 [Auricularia subglabra TFB-10046 SS5]|uniref:Uncharacterized protein n=1 Tax=Auricularia subglabra (strain TFB-10046 / SS5) TaxID=717982 RepID=J0CRH3_AURST|nr:hypothetical protein AURDEDRAFT_178044 [Auricularia subglabra TFB-10046 SS5]
MPKVTSTARRTTKATVRPLGIKKAAHGPCKERCETAYAFDDTPLRETSDILIKIFSKLGQFELCGPASQYPTALPAAAGGREMHTPSSNSSSSTLWPAGGDDGPCVPKALCHDHGTPSRPSPVPTQATSLHSQCTESDKAAEITEPSNPACRVVDALRKVLVDHPGTLDGHAGAAKLAEVLTYLADLSQTIRESGDSVTEIVLEIDTRVIDLLATAFTSCEAIGDERWDPRSVINYIVAEMVRCKANPDAIRGFHMETTKPPYLPPQSCHVGGVAQPELKEPSPMKTMGGTAQSCTSVTKTNFPADATVFVFVDMARLFSESDGAKYWDPDRFYGRGQPSSASGIQSNVRPAAP